MLRASKKDKEKVIKVLQEYEEALRGVLDSVTIKVAKEIAADALNDNEKDLKDVSFIQASLKEDEEEEEEELDLEITNLFSDSNLNLDENTVLLSQAFITGNLDDVDDE